MKNIDLNCEMGESPEAIADGTQEVLLPHVTSVSIACGGHAGDEATMRATIRQALHWNVAIGAHPSYPDRAHFGRVEMNLSPDAIAAAVFEQVTALDAIAADCGTRTVYVKAHGALYNQAARDPKIAQAIARGVAKWRSEVAMVGLAGSVMLGVFRAANFPTVGEAYADRHYESDGSLRARKFDDALIRDPAAAARQALDVVERASVETADGSRVALEAQTICIHSDTPGAAEIAAAVTAALRGAGVTLRSFSK